MTKPLSEREHICPECQYRTHRDHAAGQMVLLRGLESVVPKDIGELKEPVAGVLAGMETSSQVPKTRKGVTRNSKK